MLLDAENRAAQKYRADPVVPPCPPRYSATNNVDFHFAYGGYCIKLLFLKWHKNILEMKQIQYKTIVLN